MNVKPELIIKTALLLRKLTCISPWTGNENIKKFQKIIWFFLVLNKLKMVILLLMSAYFNRGDKHLLIEKISLSSLHIDTLFDYIFWKINENKLHELLQDAAAFIKNSTSNKKLIYQRYINRYFIFILILYSGASITIISFTFTPLFLPQLLPETDYYPFFTITPFTIIYCIIYFLQILALLQTLTIITIVLSTVILFCHVLTELKLLFFEFKKINDNNHQLRTCLDKHRQCISYVNQLNYLLRFLTLKRYTSLIITLTFAAVPLIFHRNIFDMMRGFFFVAASLIDLYVITLPADDLHDLSTQISSGIYESNWIGNSLSVQKSLIIMMCRAQKPLVINVEGILPALTCQFYAASVSFIVSFFMTLRALVVDK